jgi:hypothetical protein
MTTGFVDTPGDGEAETRSTPRSQLVDESVTPWYHCVPRCLRRTWLCGGGSAHRKDWIVGRLRELVVPALAAWPLTAFRSALLAGGSID